MTVALVVAAAAAVALDAGPATSDANACDHVANALMHALQMAQVAKEPEGTVRRVFDDATNAQPRCAASEAVTYLRIRSAELGKGSFVGDLTPAARTEWRQLADDAAMRFPRSARILAVDARATGKIEIARRAVAADDAYAPARVALASALIASGDPASAAKMLDGLSGLDATSDGFAVLARARLASSDLLGALRAAKDQFTKRKIELIEPDAGNQWPVVDAHEVAGFAALGLRRYDEAARHLVVADFGSAKVREILAHPPPPLRRALRKVKGRRPR
jgi:hypothetical protein